jgi:translation initiation factor 1 (eIF-1/SUI1)
MLNILKFQPELGKEFRNYLKILIQILILIEINFISSLIGQPNISWKKLLTKTFLRTNFKKIHLRLVQRNFRKHTSIEGFASNQSPEITHKDLLYKLKKLFGCNGVIKEDEEKGKIIILYSS